MKAEGSLPTYDELMARQRLLMSLRRKPTPNRIFVAVDGVEVLMALKEELI